MSGRKQSASMSTTFLPQQFDLKVSSVCTGPQMSGEAFLPVKGVPDVLVPEVWLLSGYEEDLV